MTSAVIAFAVAAAVSLAAGSKVIDLLARLKLRQTISEDAPDRHRSKAGTPMMGGLIIFLGAAVGIAAVRMIDPRVAAVIFLTLAFMATGFLDDYLIASRGKSLGLKARQKLFIQFLLATLFVVWLDSIRSVHPTSVMLWNGQIDLGWAWYPLAVLMIVGMSNAFNLADGLDGLVAGMTVILALTLGMLVVKSVGVLVAPVMGLTVVAWAIAGGCVGFLWYNCNPARIFMGDTGSLALGAATAGIALVARIELVYLIIGVIFIIEALSVMIQVASFKLTGKRPFKMTPIHHHFELSGWPEQRIVTRLWIAQGMICLAVLAWKGFLEL